MTSMRQSLAFVTISIVFAACAPTQPDRVGDTPTPSTSSATLPACQPSQIQPSRGGFPEIQGTMKSAGELWALLFFDKAQASQDEKIVWRITSIGTGNFEVQARHEDGTLIRPIWGPEYHVSSSWERPGDEWGTGFNFPEPGCWTLTVMRGATIGEIRLDVAPPAQATASATDEEAEIRDLVENFGKRLQTVSLLAADAAREMQQQYADFVSPALLETWMKDVTKAPGRIVSSPWPERIDITTLSKEGSDRYVITGFVIEVTSVEMVNGGAAARLPVRIVVQRGPGRWLIADYSEAQ